MNQTESTSLTSLKIKRALEGTGQIHISSAADLDMIQSYPTNKNRLRNTQAYFTCVVCGTEQHKTIQRIDKFPIACKQCLFHSQKDEIIRKREQTCLVKYGKRSSLQVKELREKGYATNLERYGAKFPQTTEALKAKVRATCIARYGVDAPSKSPAILAKQLQTNLDKYGVSNANKLEITREKIKKTKLLRYNDENYSNIAKGKATKLSRYGDENYNNIEKMKSTQLERYGGIGFASPELASKVRAKIMEMYGVDHPMHDHDLFCKGKRKYEYNGIHFDSKPEIVLYQYLIDNNIPFEYHPKVRLTYWFNNKRHYYYPDFQINGALVELKGSHFFEDGKMINPYDRTMDELFEAKHQCMLQNNVNIIIV